jgi:hypothetical protein
MWKDEINQVTNYVSQTGRKVWGRASFYGKLADESMAVGFGRAYTTPRGMTKWAFSGRHHEAGMKWVKDMLVPGKKVAGAGVLRNMFRFLGPAITAYSVLKGYEEGGLKGAVTEGVGGLAWAYGIGRVGSMIFSPTAALTVAGAGLAMTAAGVNPLSFAARPYTRDYAKRHAKLELASPVVDPFGTVSTMRQRSVMAIQNSKINGRSMLGNEAIMGWKPYNL